MIRALRLAAAIALVLFVSAGAPAVADGNGDPPDRAAGNAVTALDLPWAGVVSRWIGGRSLDASLSAAVLFGVASLAPALVLMTTSFVRISIVLTLLRQGLAAQLPSNQVIASLALFLSALVIWPVWTQAWSDGVGPYQAGQIDLSTAVSRGSLPVRRWMATQIEDAGNRDTMLLFLQRHPARPAGIRSYDDVPLESLLPAFLVSELDVAFGIGFRLLLPFLMIDLLVATLIVASGLVTVSPTVVALPLKLMVFVMADGWTLVVRALLDGLLPSG